MVLLIFVVGYGLQVTRDVISGGTGLPKVLPKKIVVFGVEGIVLKGIYFIIQGFLLMIISIPLNFPAFDLEEFFVDYHATLTLAFHHDMLSFIIFIISGFIISYVTIFFMELSLARLADGGKFWQSFNLRSIKHTIDVIGWKRYTIAYTKIILVIVIFTFANNFSDPYFGWNIVIGILSQFIIFIVEYRGVGNIYKLYVNNKEKIDGLNS